MMRRRGHFYIVDVISVLTDVADAEWLFHNNSINPITQSLTIYAEDAEVARRGGSVAREARQRLEAETGKSFISPLNAKSIRKGLERKRDEASMNIMGGFLGNSPFMSTFVLTSKEY